MKTKNLLTSCCKNNWVAFSFTALGCILLLFNSCAPPEARSSLPCPDPCKDKCKFSIFLDGTKDAKACGGAGGYKNVKVKMLKTSPSEECIADIDREPMGSTGAINWELCNGTKCELTAKNFPDGSPIPYDPNKPELIPVGKEAVSKDCYASFTTSGTKEAGGGHEWLEVKNIKVNFDLVTFCTCNGKKNEGSIGYTHELK